MHIGIHIYVSILHRKEVSLQVTSKGALKGDAPAQEQLMLIWYLQLVFEPVTPFSPCTASLLIAQIYAFFKFMLKRGRSFEEKKCSGVNDHFYMDSSDGNLQWIRSADITNLVWEIQLELESRLLSSVHKLVQFCCVTAGKPLGCQFSYSPEKLECEVIVKLGYLFVKHFGSLWWKVLDSCMVPCGL